MCQRRLSKKLTLSLLPLRHPYAGHRRPPLAGVGMGSCGLDVLAVVSDDSEDSALEDLVHATHLLAAALHVLGVHLLSDGHALLRSDGCEPLGLEHVDAGLLVAEVRLEADENEGRVWAEMEHLRVPLREVSARPAVCKEELGKRHTLSSTLSSEFGQSMAKQTKMRSVSG